MASRYHDQGYHNGGTPFGGGYGYDYNHGDMGRSPASMAFPHVTSGLVMLMVAAKTSVLPLACTSCASDEDAVRYVIKRIILSCT